MISISIVSHGHGELVRALLADLARLGRETALEVIVTNNIAVDRVGSLPEGVYGRIVDNPVPLGFGHNHNNALSVVGGEHVCIMNPDIRMPLNPFPFLLREADGADTGVVAPAILAADRRIEDSARRFPTPWSLLRRRTGGDDGRYHFEQGDPSVEVDWVAGMFMLCRTDRFRAVGGFDQRYFLYCEDLDLCARMWRAGLAVKACPSVAAIHDARRDSHRKLKFMWWHATSYVRYFGTHWRQPLRSQ